MKIIDIYNKIANGEEVPHFIIDEQEYYVGADGFLKAFFGDDVEWCVDKDWLNTEVEIIEEKKIPEKLDIRQEKNIKNNWKWKVYGKEHSYNISTPQKIIADKINEILDTLEMLNDKIK